MVYMTDLADFTGSLLEQLVAFIINMTPGMMALTVVFGVTGVIGLIYYAFQQSVKLSGVSA